MRKWWSKKFVLVCILIISLQVDVRAASTPYFYQVKKGDAVSYLLGTIHTGPGLKDLKPSVERCIRRSRVLLSEVVNTRAQTRLQVEQPFESAKSQDQIEDWISLGSKLRLVFEYGLPVSVAFSLEKASCLEIEALLLESRGLHQLDLEIALLGFDLNLPMQMLDSLELRKKTEEADGVAFSITNPMSKICRPEFSIPLGQIDSYLSSASDVEAYLAESDQDMDVNLSLVVDRNQAWLPNIVPELTTGGAFVYVGLDHLNGKFGLVNLLRQQGFSVDPAPEDSCR